MILWLLIAAGALAAFLMAVGALEPPPRNANGRLPTLFQPRGAGLLGRVSPSVAATLTRAGARRALREDGVNARYLRQLKQADWYWAPDELAPPQRRAPFWNLETLWAEKIIAAAVAASLAAAATLAAGYLVALAAELQGARTGGLVGLLVALAALAIGALCAGLGFTGPDAGLAAAASVRQRELSLELGFRIGEIRSDVLAGITLPTAIANLSRRPGGPFIEELRRMTAALRVDADEVAAVDTLIDRNHGNEFVIEFGNTVRMALLHGARVESALNALAESAQIRLRQTIQAQGRRNALEMGRPVALTTTLVISLLVMAPALAAILEGIG